MEYSTEDIPCRENFGSMKNTKCAVKKNMLKSECQKTNNVTNF